MLSDILIIGSGPAGYTAAIYASRAGRKTRIIAGPQLGGQLMITSSIENYPGFANIISGAELMENMKRQTENLGVQITNDTIVNVDFSDKILKCTGESGEIYSSKAVIIATGASAKWLNIPGEKEYLGAGVSACATCDGFFFKNKDVAVIGGGNVAVEDAIFLTHFANSVTLIHRRNELKAEKILQNRLFENQKINILWDTVATEVIGDTNKVTALSLVNIKTEKAFNKPIDGIFIAIGHGPATSIFNGKIALDKNGYIITEKSNSCTSVKGVFAAGDVCDPYYRQAITSAGQGCMAAIDADRFLSE